MNLLEWDQWNPIERFNDGDNTSGRIILKCLKKIIYEINLYRDVFVFLTKIFVYTFIDFYIISRLLTVIL